MSPDYGKNIWKLIPVSIAVGLLSGLIVWTAVELVKRWWL